MFNREAGACTTWPASSHLMKRLPATARRTVPAAHDRAPAATVRAS
jgi:hypothetical protein